MSAPELGADLATLNAFLNASSGALVFAGWRAIRRGNRALHRRLMLSAFGCSVLFLASYVTRFLLTGAHRYPGGGPARAIYLAILGSHTLLAAATVPLVLGALWLALSGRFAKHRKLARWAFPVWTYVSVTGVVVYLMLYHLAPHLP